MVVGIDGALVKAGHTRAGQRHQFEILTGRVEASQRGGEAFAVVRDLDPYAKTCNFTPMAHLFWPLELVNARIIQISDRQQVATAQGDYPGAWRNPSLVRRNSI